MTLKDNGAGFVVGGIQCGAQREARAFTAQQENEAHWLRYQFRLIAAQAENCGLLISATIDEREEMEPVVTLATGHGRVLTSYPIKRRDVVPLPLDDANVLTASDVFEHAPEEAWLLLLWAAKRLKP